MKVRFARAWDGPTDRWGEFKIYPAGIVAEDLDDLNAIFVIATGRAASLVDLTEGQLADVALVRQIVDNIAAADRVAATISDVARVLVAAAQQQTQAV